MHSKLVRAPGIYLVGFMGSGKTTIGLLLAEELGWGFADLDDDIEAEQKSTIAEMFQTRGEEEFRRVEHEALRKRVRTIQYGHPTVLAMGGGTFVQKVNFDLVEDNGITVWLDCPFSVIERRVAACGTRPLAVDRERFEALYHDRHASYAKADYRIEISSDDPKVALGHILDLPIF